MRHFSRFVCMVALFCGLMPQVSLAGTYNAYVDYFNQLGLFNLETFSTENVGLNKFNDKLMSENSCYERLVQNFYEEVTGLDAANVQDYPQRENLLFNNLSVTTETGPLPNQWLWDLANKKTKGDANMAMMLIGACGHDNEMQKVKSTPKTSFNLCETNRKLGQKVTGRVNSMYLMSDCGPETIEYLNFGVSACPSAESYMFRQGALGKETILPLSLRQEIGKIQAPRKGWENLPSKYYHTIGAAYLTCQLKIQGFSKKRALQLQLSAIRGYRHRRLCQENIYSENVERIPRMAAYMGKYRLTYEDMVERYDKGADDLDFPEELKIFSGLETKEKKMAALRRLLAAADAAVMLKSLVYTNSLCVKFGKGATDKFKAVIDYYDPPWMTTERIAAARELMKTWWIDLVWSEEQHRLGVEFAYDHCQEDESHLETLNERACEYLEVDKKK